MQIKQRMFFDGKGAYPVRFVQIGQEYVRVLMAVPLSGTASCIKQDSEKPAIENEIPVVPDDTSDDTEEQDGAPMYAI